MTDTHLLRFFTGEHIRQQVEQVLRSLLFGMMKTSSTFHFFNGFTEEMHLAPHIVFQRPPDKFFRHFIPYTTLRYEQDHGFEVGNDIRTETQVLVDTALRKTGELGKYYYKKAGVIVWGICRDNAIQGNLFDTVNREKQAALAKAIDAINRKNGHNKIRVAVQGDEKGWQLKREYISKQYTMNLEDVIVLKTY